MEFVLALNLDESALVEACVRQERWAQQRLYEEFYGSMMSVCLRYAGQEEEARDMLHEAFMKVFRAIGRYRSGTSLTAWVRTIVVNTCIDHYRRNARRRTEDLDQSNGLYMEEETPLDSISAEEILALIRELSPAYRMVFNLFVLEGYSHREIGEMLDITESTSRSNLVKARMKLQQAIKARR